MTQEGSLSMLALLCFFIACSWSILNYNQRRAKSVERSPLVVSGKQRPDELFQDKILFHQLQNQEQYPDVFIHAQKRLVELLDQTVHASMNDPGDSILSVKDFSTDGLHRFLTLKQAKTASSFESYLQRRKAGGFRELFPTIRHAKYWLAITAPVRLVDGAWMASSHRVDTPPAVRRVSRVVWQILSEELGDGDLSKNHIHLFTELLSASCGWLPDGASPAFVAQTTNTNNNRGIWTSAAIQMAIAADPEQFFPEILGFTLAYEMVSMETLVAGYELKELGLDATYFDLHITIDNGASGHTAMATNAVDQYLNAESLTHPGLWQRVQAGFALCDYLADTMHQTNEAESRILKVFSEKIVPAKTSHLGCTGLIGGRHGMNLNEWLNIDHWETSKTTFLGALAGSRWIDLTNPIESKLVKELTWGGRMFGAFTEKEIAVVVDWISRYKVPSSSEKAARGCYTSFTGYVPHSPRKSYPIHSSALDIGAHFDHQESIFFECTQTDWSRPYWELLLVSTVPLQYFLANPAKSSTLDGMCVLQILRTLHGLSAVRDAVAGMDEVLEPSNRGVAEIAHDLRDQSYGSSANSTDYRSILESWKWLESTAKAPMQNLKFLLGVELAFMVCVLKNRAFSVRCGIRTEDAEYLVSVGHEVTRLICQSISPSDIEVRRGFWTLVAALQ